MIAGPAARVLPKEPNPGAFPRKRRTQLRGTRVGLTTELGDLRLRVVWEGLFPG